ncbi:MAG: electron transport complex subunit RsxC [Enterococcus sp.]
MKKTLFTGGIDFGPSTIDLKERFTLEPEIVVYEPEEVKIPFNQHIGAPNKVQVAIGERVRAGQTIAMSDEAISGHVHASISGIVTDICEVPTLDGKTQTAVVIKRDNTKKERPILPLSLEGSVIERVREAGVVGLGGATFPTHIKLATPNDDLKIRYLILNGAECEPLIHSDDYLMRQFSEEIIRGAQIVCESLHVEKILIAIERDKPEAIERMKKTAAKFSNCQVFALPTRYPQGGQKQLVETLLGVEAPLNQRTSETGALTINVATAKAIYDAIACHEPLLRRLITVTGDVKKRQVISFPLGTCISELIAFCDGIDGKLSRILHGGPMMGIAVHHLQTPLTKGSNGLVVLNQEHDQILPESPCIRCNRCVKSCPMRLEPQMIDQAMRVGDFVRCAQLQAEQCINCGCCTYVCPAKRQLAAKITEAKKTLKRIRKEARQ